MAELCDIVSQYIGFEPNEIHLPGGNRIHIGWLLACTVTQAKKVLINLPEDSLSKKILVQIEKKFEEVPLAPVLIQ